LFAAVRSCFRFMVVPLPVQGTLGRASTLSYRAAESADSPSASGQNDGVTLPEPPGDGSARRLFLVGQPRGVTQGGVDVLRLQRGVLAQDLLARLAGPEVVENDRDQDAGPLDTGLAVANPGIDGNPFPPIGQPGRRSFACHVVAPHLNIDARQA